MKIYLEERKQEKQALRSEMKQKRSCLSADEVREYSQQIIAKLPQLYPVSKAKTIMAFLSIQNEVDLLPFVNRMKEEGRRIILPRVEKDGNMVGVEFTDLQSCKTSSFGIPEPVGEAVPADEIDVVLVPGLVYDGNGFRLGYGKGYYDRFLAKLPVETFKCGICYDFQIVDDVFPHPQDISVHWIVTEKSELALDFNYF